MEDILASIRRIIAEDDRGPAGTEARADDFVPGPLFPPERAAAPPHQAYPAAPQHQQVQARPSAETAKDEIDAIIADLDRATGRSRAPESYADPFAPPRAVTPAERPAPIAVPQAYEAPSPVMPAEPIVQRAPPAPYPRTFRPDPPASSGAPLANQVLSRPAPADPLLSPAATQAVDQAFGNLAQHVLGQNGQHLDDVVREMLRPMLKAWLDDNLPSVVERLVRAEIERVSRGRG